MSVLPRQARPSVSTDRWSSDPPQLSSSTPDSVVALLLSPSFFADTIVRQRQDDLLIDGDLSDNSAPLLPASTMPLGGFLAGITYEPPVFLRQLAALDAACSAWEGAGLPGDIFTPSAGRLRREAEHLGFRLRFRIWPTCKGSLLFRWVLASRLRASGWTLPEALSREALHAAVLPLPSTSEAMAMKAPSSSPAGRDSPSLSLLAASPSRPRRTRRGARGKRSAAPALGVPGSSSAAWQGDPLSGLQPPPERSLSSPSFPSLPLPFPSPPPRPRELARLASLTPSAPSPLSPPLHSSLLAGVPLADARPPLAARLHPPGAL